MNNIYSIILIIMVFTASSWGYTTIGPVAVHDRLVDGDTLILLDVREFSEYQSGHIAEPPGQLPITPVLMPIGSGILYAQYTRLPTDVDIIVYCASGGRSASASSYLDGQGFTRIFNMSGGFYSWSFENRGGSYGDHTGKWIIPSDSTIVKIRGMVTCDTSLINFTTDAVPVPESIYVEFHFASGMFPLPPGIPSSDCDGLFRTTALDPFGVLLFEGDSLPLSDVIDIDLIAQCSGSDKIIADYIMDENLTAFIPTEGWRSISFTHDGCLFIREENILRRWYNTESYEVGITSEANPENYKLNIFPNPFNSKVQINVSEGASVEIFNIEGKRIVKSDKFDTGYIWVPESNIGTGLYFVKVNFSDHTETSQILYLK